MGWIQEYKTITWGDAPQDLIDAAIRKIIKGDFQKVNKLSKTQKMIILALLLSDEKLRHSVDGEFIEAWNRRANDQEFKYHIKFGLGLT